MDRPAGWLRNLVILEPVAEIVGELEKRNGSKEQTAGGDT